MSIESEILRIQHNVADTYAAVAGKGGEVPLQPNSVKLAAAVESIPQDYGGVPIGTIISFMGTKAPKDYLICDGTSYPISQYPGLATFIAGQFGSSNHFGGDGETTFAVPDLRNLFLRGYHGEAEELLSGEVGVKQDATEIPGLAVWSNIAGTASVAAPAATHSKPPENADKLIGEQLPMFAGVFPNDVQPGSQISYTSRPVNLAVLYCIKAVPSKSADGEVYSTEETRIGTWIDGKPLYRKCFAIGPVANDTPLGIENVDLLIDCAGYGVSDSVQYPLNGSHFLRVVKHSGTVPSLSVTSSEYSQIWGYAIYTKTTDSAAQIDTEE